MYCQKLLYPLGFQYIHLGLIHKKDMFQPTNPEVRLVSPIRHTGLLFTFFIVSILAYAPNLSAQCGMNGTFSVVNASKGSPLTGPFQADEELEICFDIDWGSIECTWLHGVVPDFGDGWDASSFNNGEPQVTQPFFSQNTTMQWYEDQEVFYNNINATVHPPFSAVGAGWFVFNGSPGTVPNCPQSGEVEPNCSCGLPQACNNIAHYKMCFKLKTKPLEQCTGTENYTIKFNTFADSETGGLAFPDTPCPFDPDYFEDYEVLCCTPPEMISKSTDYCSASGFAFSMGSLLIGGVNPNDFDLSWTIDASSDLVFSGIADCSVDCDPIVTGSITNPTDVPQIVTFNVAAVSMEGCKNSSQVTMTINPRPKKNDLAVTLCPDGCVDLSTIPAAIGGTGTLSYDWGMDVNVCLTESNFLNYTATDENGCTFSSAQYFVVLEEPSVSILPFTYPQLCEGDDYEFIRHSIFYNGDFEFEWIFPNGDTMTTDTIFPNQPGVYSLVVSDADMYCPFNYEIEVPEMNELPEVLLSSLEDQVCQGNGPYDLFQYNVEGGTFEGDVNTAGEFLATELGLQTVTYNYTDPITGCNNSATVEIEVINDPVACSVGTDDLELPDYVIFPNPANEFLMVQLPEGIREYKIYNALGKLMSAARATNEIEQITIENWANGVYWLQLDGYRLKSFLISK